MAGADGIDRSRALSDHRHREPESGGDGRATVTFEEMGGALGVRWRRIGIGHRAMFRDP